MPKAELQRFLEHIVDRQMVHGPEAAFRFKHIKLGGEIVPACYSEDAASDHEEEQQVARVPRRPKRVRKRQRANDTPIAPGLHGAPHAPGDTVAPVTNPTIQLHQPTHIPSMIIIGQAEMDVIRENTQIIVLAHNGPGDGPPRYQVPLTLFHEVFGSIDPSLVTSTTRGNMSDSPLIHPSPASTSPDPAPTHSDPASRLAPPADTQNDPGDGQTHKNQTTRIRKEKGEVQTGVTSGGAGRATRATTRASARELRSHKTARQRKRK